jgi:hypothetical protein
MASAELSRRVGKVVGYPPLCEMDPDQRREFHEALLDAARFEDLPGKWQAAILGAEENRPKLRILTRDQPRSYMRQGKGAAPVRRPTPLGSGPIVPATHARHFWT